jgi:hypothetical protein
MGGRCLRSTQHRVAEQFAGRAVDLAEVGHVGAGRQAS